MVGKILRAAFLAVIGVMVAAWAVSLAESSQVEPTYDPTVQWLA